MTQLSAAFPNVGFGTSGVRALVTQFEFPVVAAFVQAFARHVMATCAKPAVAVVGWDLRPSSPSIAAMVVSALEAEGWSVEIAGLVPTPALALRCMSLKAAGVMITGSHIPFDRNGMKFYTPYGEILKSDEQAILSSPVTVNALPTTLVTLPRPNPAARDAYLARYAFGGSLLTGLRVGVYQHSAVGRDLLVEILQSLGAFVVPLGRSDMFVPIDTEAVSPEDEARAAVWAREHQLDAVVSTDGDGDRPWICDAEGRFVRGDLLGLLTARWLGVRAIVTPVSATTALERSGAFDRVVRTRIGSPYVIEGMQMLAQGKDPSQPDDPSQSDDPSRANPRPVAGFEANGGFLLQDAVVVAGVRLLPLPTRDSVLPIVALLATAVTRRMSIAALLAELPSRATMADRLTETPSTQSAALLQRLRVDPQHCEAFIQTLTQTALVSVDWTDGVRMTTGADEIVHLRPSGNAPELRVYTEAATLERATQLCRQAMVELPRLFNQP